MTMVLSLSLRRRDPPLRMHIPLLLLLIHASYGFGFLTTTPSRPQHHSLRMSSSTSNKPDQRYYSEAPSASSSSPKQQRVTLTRFLQNKLKKNPKLADLDFLLSIQMACKTIASLVHRTGLVYTPNTQTDYQTTQYPPQDGRFYSMKRLDELSTNVLRNALQFTGKVNLVTPAVQSNKEEPAQHQPGVLIASAIDSNYVAVLDPLDGSGNADASICTGTVFGVFENANNSNNSEEGTDNVVVGGSDSSSGDLLDAVLQPAKNMVAAGYCLYSSATVLVFTLGEGCVYGFTLDPQTKEFVLTHSNLTIPQRGNVYSCNEANSEGWSEEFRAYLKALKLGENQTKRRYAHRYVGSMVGDIHRTLLYGGVFCYPSDTGQHPEGNLQLLYKSAPMAFVVHQAGGKATNGIEDLLNVKPERIHQKSPCFMGSPEDIEELQSYLQKEEE